MTPKEKVQLVVKLVSELTNDDYADKDNIDAGEMLIRIGSGILAEYSSLAEAIQSMEKITDAMKEMQESCHESSLPA